MWIGTPITTSTSQFRSIPHFPSLAASASTPKSNPPPTCTISSSQVSLKGLGHAVINLTTTTHKSNSAVDGGGGQLTGSEILLAIQQADLRKKNKKKTKRVSSRLSGQSDNDDDDDDDDGGGGGVDESSGVKPLMIKSDWGKRIEDLERRLRNISEF